MRYVRSSQRSIICSRAVSRRRAQSSPVLAVRTSTSVARAVSTSMLSHPADFPNIGEPNLAGMKTVLKALYPRSH
jgi:hypothetical protein